MTASLQDIRYWLEKAKELKATHLIVALDSYDHINYPVYITANKDVNKEYNRIVKSNMQSVDEVYNMSISLDKQLSEFRSHNI